MILHGFELIDERNIPELNTYAQFYCHQKTGAELLSLQNDDENKVFGVTFRTPPSDSTGLPHIMEHAVLGGSKIDLRAAGGRPKNWPKRPKYSCVGV